MFAKLCSKLHSPLWIKRQNYYKVLWKELVACFPLIRHARHRKELQQFFVVAGTSLLSSYLTTIRDTQK
jgi:hypothetical protein